jgi:hypothetical protein
MEELPFSTSEDSVYRFKIKCDNPVRDNTHAILCLVEEETNLIVEPPLKRDSFSPSYKVILEQLADAIQEGKVGSYYPASTFETTDYDTLLQPCLEKISHE